MTRNLDATWRTTDIDTHGRFNQSLSTDNETESKSPIIKLSCHILCSLVSCHQLEDCDIFSIWNIQYFTIPFWMGRLSNTIIKIHIQQNAPKPPAHWLNLVPRHARPNEAEFTFHLSHGAISHLGALFLILSVEL